MNNQSTTAADAPKTADPTMFSLLQVAHALEDKLESALSGVGLSTPKFSVLSELVSAGIPLSLSELASRLSCVRSNMTQLVDRLEADGLVRREDDPSDRRAVKAAITEQGRDRQAAGAAEVGRLQQEFAVHVSDADRAAVQRLLTALK